MARQTRDGRRISDTLLVELLPGQDPAEVFRDWTLTDDLKKSVAAASASWCMERDRTRDFHRLRTGA